MKKGVSSLDEKITKKWRGFILHLWDAWLKLQFGQKF